MDRQNAFIAGATIGLTIAAPIGPMALLCIRRTLKAGLHAGLSTGAGASTLHLTYTAIALAGVDHLAHWLRANHALFDLASASILLFFAFRCFRPPTVPADAVARAPHLGSLTRNYVSAIGFGAVNPMSLILLIGAVAGMMGADQPYPADAAILLCGVFLGSFGWWCVLAGTVAAVDARLDPRIIRGLDLIAGIAMGALALVALHRL